MSEQVHRSCRETLIRQRNRRHEPAQFFGRRGRGQKEEDTARGLPRRDGAGRAVAGAAEGHRPVLPGGRSRPQALPNGIDAAGAPDAELVRAERSGDGGSNV